MDPLRDSEMPSFANNDTSKTSKKIEASQSKMGSRNVTPKKEKGTWGQFLLSAGEGISNKFKRQPPKVVKQELPSAIKAQKKRELVQQRIANSIQKAQALLGIISLDPVQTMLLNHLLTNDKQFLEDFEKFVDKSANVREENLQHISNEETQNQDILTEVHLISTSVYAEDIEPYKSLSYDLFQKFSFMVDPSPEIVNNASPEQLITWAKKLEIPTTLALPKLTRKIEKKMLLRLKKALDEEVKSILTVIVERAVCGNTQVLSDNLNKGVFSEELIRKKALNAARYFWKKNDNTQNYPLKEQVLIKGGYVKSERLLWEKGTWKDIKEVSTRPSEEIYAPELRSSLRGLDESSSSQDEEPLSLEISDDNAIAKKKDTIDFKEGVFVFGYAIPGDSAYEVEVPLNIESLSFKNHDQRAEFFRILTEYADDMDVYSTTAQQQFKNGLEKLGISDKAFEIAQQFVEEIHEKHIELVMFVGHPELENDPRYSFIKDKSQDLQSGFALEIIDDAEATFKLVLDNEKSFLQTLVKQDPAFLQKLNAFAQDAHQSLDQNAKLSPKGVETINDYIWNKKFVKALEVLTEAISQSHLESEKKNQVLKSFITPIAAYCFYRFIT